MPVEVFKSKDGMLTIEKNNAPVRRARAFRSAVAPKAVKKLSAEDALDTVFAYQIYPFAYKSENSVTGTCKFCGAVTEDENLHVCEACWRENQQKIKASLKSIIKDKAIEVE